MPLLDHFTPPLSRTHPWRGFHSAWASTFARHLNHGVLPHGYYAIPNVELDGPVEIGTGVEALAPWAPPALPLAVALDFPALDLVEVQVLFDDEGPHLTAAVELVSPRNQDRPAARRAFTVTCVSYLHQGTSVVVVDTVTTRRAQFHDEILRLLGLDGGEWHSPTQLYAVAYRSVGTDEQRQLQAWPEPLVIGAALPRLPLWLGTDICVPLDLEATYQATCADLRIRQAG